MDKRVTTGRISRRKHDEAFKRELVERSLQPGASVAAIALENGINANLLFNWRRLYLRARRRHASDDIAGADVAAGDGGRTASPTAQARLLLRSLATPSGVIEIDIGGCPRAPARRGRRGQRALRVAGAEQPA